jgi:hypothetical protein
MEFTWNSLVWRTCKLKILCHGCVVFSCRPKSLACMHASSLTLPTMHACVIYSLSTAWLWWLRYRRFGAKMV